MCLLKIRRYALSVFTATTAAKVSNLVIMVLACSLGWVRQVLINQLVPKNGRSRPPGMCTSLLHCPHSRLVENGVDLGWDGPWGWVWGGMVCGMGWDWVEWGWNVEWVVVLKPENHYFVNIDPLKGKLTSQREGFATFLAAL